MAHPDRKPDHDLCDGDVLTAGGIELQVITTPGHSPGSSCLYAPELATVFTGDTLFQGGPGATGRSFSSFDTIIDSIRTRLLTLPADTTVRRVTATRRRSARSCRTWRSGSCGGTETTRQK